MTITERMVEIGRALATQDNQATSHPMFLVQQSRRQTGLDPRWGVPVVWLDNEGAEVEAEEAKALEAAFEETGEEPADRTRTGYVDLWEFVTCCFTDAAARSYIEANKHRLNRPRVYVDSAYRNAEFIAVRQHLQELAR
jgi:hypothetical protein